MTDSLGVVHDPLGAPRYILLDPGAVLGSLGGPLASTLSSLLELLPTDGLMALCKVRLLSGGRGLLLGGWRWQRRDANGQGEAR